MAGVYLSYPFCAQKCTYCNFASGVLPRTLEPRYLDALLREILGHAWRWTPDTVYWGGGTPSLIAGGDLARVMGAIPGLPWREATMEAAPGGITAEHVRQWRAAGINRVSLGVQSFVARELARTGRKHTAQAVEEEVGRLRKEGITNFNIDLIAGLPGQTEASWKESLDWVDRIGAPHVSVYMLEVDEDSRLGAEIIAFGERYGAREVPGEDQVADFYEIAVDRLRAMGVLRYEISNFARPGYESLHNLKYWRREPYMGFGADAHSFDGDWRWQNVELAAEYVEGAKGPEHVRADEGGETYFLGLRLSEGVVDGGGPLAARLARFEERGLVERVNGRVRLTPKGVLLSNEVFAEFV